jgi:hypothetical protein
MSELISRSFLMRLTTKYTMAEVRHTTTSAMGMASTGFRPKPDSTE